MVDFGSNGLIIIYDFVKGPVKKAQLKAYVDHYLIDNKVFFEFKTIPIYRYYNRVDHYYTKTPGLYSGYVDEGIEFNAFATQQLNTVPIYQYWNGKDHYYSRSSVAPSGYIKEGIEFYAY